MLRKTIDLRITCKITSVKETIACLHTTEILLCVRIHIPHIHVNAYYTYACTTYIHTYIYFALCRILKNIFSWFCDMKKIKLISLIDCKCWALFSGPADLCSIYSRLSQWKAQGCEIPQSIYSCQRTN